MKTILNKFKTLDNIDKFGVLFGIFVLTPLVVTLVIDIIINGAKML